VASDEAGAVRLESVPTTLDAQLDALWAITQLVWDDPALDSTAALASLELVG
jgi:alkylhydroperoxidase family enzyme